MLDILYKLSKGLKGHFPFVLSALFIVKVRERREKTRLRVARWRAKRKLQACLNQTQVSNRFMINTLIVLMCYIVLKLLSSMLQLTDLSITHQLGVPKTQAWN